MDLTILALIIGIGLGIVFYRLALRKKIFISSSEVKNTTQISASNNKYAKKQYKKSNPPVIPVNFKEQLSYLNQCNVTPKKLMTRESSRCFYDLKKWIEDNKRKWYLSCEVSMGAFIEIDTIEGSLTPRQAASAYNSKRVDFLIIDSAGMPKCVIEFNGSGHNVSGDAGERMLVKKTTLKKANIPLIEISNDYNKDCLYTELALQLGLSI